MADFTGVAFEHSQIAKDLAMGRYDAEIPAIVEAVALRANQLKTDVRWRITLEDLVVDEENVTLDELVRVEELTKRTWLSVDPRKSARDCKAFMQAVLESRAGLSAAEAVERLGSMRAPEIMAALAEYVVEPPAPFDSPSESSS